MTGDWHVIDVLSVTDCVINPCGQIGDVPQELRVDWATARVEVFDYIAAARRTGDAFNVERGLTSSRGG